MLTWIPKRANLRDAMGHGQEAVRGWDSDRPRLEETDEHRDARIEMTNAFHAGWANGPMVGPVAVHVHVYFPTKYRLQTHVVGLPAGKAHLCVGAVGRALLDSNVLTMHGQIASMTATKGHDPRNPRIEVEVTPWDR